MLLEARQVRYSSEVHFNKVSFTFSTQKPKTKKEMTMPRIKQAELTNMPAPDKVGTIAQNFRTIIQRIKDAAEEKGEQEALLIKALRSAKRSSIQIDGFKFEVFHAGPKDSIKVTKPK